MLSIWYMWKQWYVAILIFLDYLFICKYSFETNKIDSDIMHHFGLSNSSSSINLAAISLKSNWCLNKMKRQSHPLKFRPTKRSRRQERSSHLWLGVTPFRDLPFGGVWPILLFTRTCSRNICRCCQLERLYLPLDAFVVLRVYFTRSAPWHIEFKPLTKRWTCSIKRN